MSLIRRRPLEANRYSMLAPLGWTMEDMAKGFGEEAGELAAWSPSVNIFDKNGKLVVEAELPGVKKDDIDVHVDNGVLTIRGERKQEDEVKEDNFYRLERSYGSFSRSFRLPSDVEADKVDAEFKDGMLVVKVPRTEEAKAKQIKIQ